MKFDFFGKVELLLHWLRPSTEKFDFTEKVELAGIRDQCRLP